MSPLYKKDSSNEKANFRPVSVLTRFCKIFERFLHDQKYDFAKSILSDNLSGFLKGHSCATALLKMTDDFRASLDNKDCIVLPLQWVYQRPLTQSLTAYLFPS